ncbi:hypothetical protein D3C74_444730 [compost metagenome]
MFPTGSWRNTKWFEIGISLQLFLHNFHPRGIAATNDFAMVGKHSAMNVHLKRSLR